MTRMYTLTILIQHNTGEPSENNEAKKIDKCYTKQKGRSKIYICMLLYIEKPNTLTKVF